MRGRDKLATLIYRISSVTQADYAPSNIEKAVDDYLKWLGGLGSNLGVHFEKSAEDYTNQAEHNIRHLAQMATYLWNKFQLPLGVFTCQCESAYLYELS